MSVFPQPPKPKNALEVHRILSPSASLRVSPLCLGSMNFGESWEGYMSTCTKPTAFEMLDHFYENGGNFIDTANNYQNEESEQWIGEWMEKRGNRDEMVIATKYTTCFDGYHGWDGKNKRIHSNNTGNGTKSLRMSVDASLKKLKTNYIDLLYLHWWDYSTSIEEVMISLNNLIREGKVLYIGVSDTPAWIVSKANQYARDHGLRPFVVYQGLWNASKRDFERDIIPMCVSEGMGFAPWGSIGGGKFKTKEQRKEATGRGAAEITEHEQKVCDALEAVAKRKNTIMTSVALAYVMHKTPNVFPIVGGRTVKHLQGNIEALELELTEEDIAEIEGADVFDHGFPQSMLSHTGMVKTPNDLWLLKMGGNFAYVSEQKPIAPSQLGLEKKTS